MALEYAPIDYLFYPPLTEQTSRAGVIPYATVSHEGQDEPQEMWLLGTLLSGRLSDFGGGCSTTRGEIPFECIIREVDEESNGLLTKAIRTALEDAHKLGVENDQPVPGVHVWRWVNLKHPENIQYLVFVKIDYEPFANIGRDFTGNEENTSIEWYSKDDLLENNVVEDFNTSIRKFMRRFGFRSKR